MLLLTRPSQLPSLSAMIPRRARCSGIGRHCLRRGGCFDWSFGRLRRNCRGDLRSWGVDVCAGRVWAGCARAGCALRVQPSGRIPEGQQHDSTQNKKMNSEEGGDSDHGVCHHLQESTSWAVLQGASISETFFRASETTARCDLVACSDAHGRRECGEGFAPSQRASSS